LPCLPEVCDLDSGVMGSVLAEAAALCAEKRMFLIIAPPASWTDLDRARGNLAELDPARGAGSYAGVYFPRIQVTDPLTGALQSYPPSGAVAGIMARTDSERGVWKAP